MKKLMLALSLMVFSWTTLMSQCNPSRNYYTGPRGGCYYLTKSDNKVYVSHACCGVIDNSVSNFAAAAPFNNTSTFDKQCGYYKNRMLYKGPKGGCYYLNKSGNKSYVSRGLCRC